MSEIKGKLHKVGTTVVVSDKFSKRCFVIETSDTYPQFIELELQQDKCNLLDGLNVGDEVDVKYNLRGRQWVNPQGEVKYFNTITAWQINVLNRFTTAPQPTQAESVGPVDDSLPF